MPETRVPAKRVRCPLCGRTISLTRFRFNDGGTLCVHSFGHGFPLLRCEGSAKTLDEARAEVTRREG